MKTHRKSEPSDYIWATSEASRQQLLVVCMIRGIVEKHGGTMEADPVNHTVSVSVPKDKADECAREVMEMTDRVYRMPLGGPPVLA